MDLNKVKAVLEWQAVQSDPWVQKPLDLLTQREGLSWKGDRLYIPQALWEGMLRQCHDTKQTGHFGFLKNLYLMQHQFWWPHMKT